jgi:hypothetical protein
MKRFAFVFALLSSVAFADGITSSISGKTGWDIKEEAPTYNLGVSVGAGLMSGVGAWAWAGAGQTAKKDNWASFVTGVDVSSGRFTVTPSYAITSGMTDSADFIDQPKNEIALKVKVRLF